MTETIGFRGWFILAVCIFLSACVSTRNDTAQVDEERALESHVMLALKYIESRNRESARHHLRRAFEIDKRSPDATFAMAMLYQLEAEPELAEKHFHKALRMDKGHTRARNNYGVFLYERERYQEAYEQFEIAANDLDYDNRSQALMNQGRAALKLGMGEKAKVLFEHANHLNPGLATLKYELARLNFEQQDYAAARSYLDEYEGMSNSGPQALLLGIKIERIFGNKDKEASYVMSLKNRFPYSQEYLEYKQILEDQ